MARKTISISVYIQKGGVGKTTAVYNIGYELSKFGFKVLIVDSDAQRNLTTQINPSHSINKELAEKFRKDLADKKDKEPPVYISVDDIFRDSIYGVRGNANYIVPTPASVSDNVEPMKVHDYESLFYIPGSIKIERLSEAITLGIAGISSSTVYVSMVTDVINSVCEKNEFDIVLYDLNPSISGLNKSIIMNTDYLIMPFKADLGSLDAVVNLCSEIPEWINRFREKNLIEDGRGPILLGSFCQLLRTRKSKKTAKSERLEQSYQNWIKQILDKTVELSRAIKEYLKDQKILTNKTTMHGIKDMVGVGLNIQKSGRPFADTSYKGHRKSRKQRGREKLVKFQKDDYKRINEASKAYKKIIGLLLSNMREEDLDRLEIKVPGFKEAIKLYGAIDQQIDSNEVDASKKDVDTSKKRSRKGSRRWYTDADISNLFRYLTESLENISFTTPMQGGDAVFSAEDLQANIHANILNAIGNDRDQESTRVLIPLNIGAKSGNRSGNHWVLAYVRFTSRVNEIYYIDPLGSDIPAQISGALTRSLRDIFNLDASVNLEITRLEGPVQQDGYNCGPWIVEACRIFAEGGDPNTLVNLDIEAARRQHTEILRNDAASNSSPRKRSTRRRKAKVLSNNKRRKTAQQPVTPMPSAKFANNLRSHLANAVEPTEQKSSDPDFNIGS